MPSYNRIVLSFCVKTGTDYTALVTLPLLRQREQTETFLLEPFTTALTFLMFAFQVLAVFLLEWETLWPKETPLPQTLHFAISIHLHIVSKIHEQLNILHFFVFVKRFFNFSLFFLRLFRYLRHP